MPRKGRAIYMIFTDLRDDALHLEEEFNDWYSNEVQPEVLALTGFLDGARYVAVRGGPKYLSVYEVEDASLVNSSARVNRQKSGREKRLAPTVIGKNRVRWIGEQVYPTEIERGDREMPPYFQIGRVTLPPEVAAEWNTWYDGVLIPGYRGTPGLEYVRRFRAVEGNSAYGIFWELESATVTSSPEWQRRRSLLPDADRMLGAMIHAAGSPGVYQRIS